MRIQHNITAMNAYRNYTSNTSAVSKNLEKLSSGYKINRAGDDAAGLAISEKMRAQVTGLKTAQKNAKDGVSLVKTGEGALTEVHDMLNRMYELAEQSANGTYDNEVDRANLQKEVNSLRTEIDRIADSVNFNGINLLDGSLSADGAGKSGSSSAITDQKAIDFVGGTHVTGVQTTSTNTKTSLAASTKGASDEAITVSYTVNGEVKTKTITLSGAATDDNKAWAKSAAEQLGQDADLKELFNITVGTTASTSNTIYFETKTAGANQAVVTGASVGTTANLFNTATATGVVTDSTVVTTGRDKAFEVTFSSVSTGDKFTIGDLKFQATANSTATLADGYIRINLAVANSDTKVASAVVQALRDNGVTSASNVDLAGTAGKKVYIDPEQISSVQNGNMAVSTNSEGIQLSNIKETGGAFTVVLGATGTTEDGANQTITIDYLDSDGNKHSVDIDYAVKKGDANTVTSAALSTALAANKDLSALFDITDGSGNLVFTAKEGTSAKAKLLSATTTDTQSDGSSTVTGLSTSTPPQSATTEMKFNSQVKAGDTVTIDGKTFQFVDKASDKDTLAEGVIGVVIGADVDASAKALNSAMKDAGIKTNFDNRTNTFKFVNESGKVSTGGKGGLTLQIGDTSDDFNKMTVAINDMHANAMGIGNVDISKQEGASDAMKVIKAAINYVSDTRGDLGATQNRLEHTINNLSVMQENIQDAESSIRDVDVAEEMMAYTKNNILVQSAQAMLAQANQLPQGVLQLLQ